MSVKVMGAVWDLKIDRDLKFVLLAYADHASHDGTSIYPAVSTIAEKTGYSERSVQAITRKLEHAGYLVADGQGIHGTNRWRIPIFGGAITCIVRGAVSAPVQSTTGGVQPTASGGCNLRHKGVQPTAPEPSLTVIKPSINKAIFSNSSSKDNVRGIEAAIAMERDVAEDDLIPEIKPPAAVMERLSVLNRNWPRYGENREFDRISRLIVTAEKDNPGMVERFVSWVRTQKDPDGTIRWYGLKPGNIWNDFGVCFGECKQLTLYEILSKQLEEEGHGSVA